MKKIAQKMNNTLFDAAAGPIYLILFGVPILIICVVVYLIVVTVRLIKRARKKRIEAQGSPEENTPPGEAQ